MSAPTGIIAYSSYVPRHRLSGEELAAAVGTRSSGRPIAGFDEDTTTMGVEAARRLISDGESAPGCINFATTAPAYADKTNATAIHAALDLGHDGHAVDMAGSARSATAAIRAAHGGGLAILSDIRTGRPGSGDEAVGADAAIALRIGPLDDAAVAEIVGSGSTTAEFLDRWRRPGSYYSDRWEERFGEQMYMPLIERAIEIALGDAGVDSADHVVISSPHLRSAKAAARAYGGQAGSGLGYAGTADAALGLAAVLDRADRGETVLVVNAVDGCDALLLRTTAAAGSGRRGPTAAEQAEAAMEVGYATYLSWRGLIERELPRRPEPDRPAGPPSARSEAWKFGFVGSACDQCGRVHVPPRRVCTKCAAIDRMERRRLADVAGTVATYTVDRLAFSPSPPMIDAVIDFDGGGRYTLEVADASPEAVAIGTRVEMTFRRLYTSNGIHNYFWKARPAGVSEEGVA